MVELNKHAQDELTEEKIIGLLKDCCNGGNRVESGNSDSSLISRSKCAAVLVPLVHTQEGWQLLLIRRTETVADHKGQVAFPGGGCEPEDHSLVETALRETMEEIGVKPDDIKVLGHLGDLMTVSNYRVAPIVGTFSWPYSFVLSTGEVSRIFTIPLAWLANPENQETRLLNHLGQEIQVIYFKPYDGEILWGATARMVDKLLEVLDLRQAGQ